VNPCGGDASATSFPVLESVITPLVADAPEIRRAAELQLKVDDPSPLLPNCSSALEPRYDPVKGRYLVASRDIIPGEVLMCEKPAVKILFRDYWDTHCQKCLKVADACVPCDFCSKVRSFFFSRIIAPYSCPYSSCSIAHSRRHVVSSVEGVRIRRYIQFFDFDELAIVPRCPPDPLFGVNERKQRIESLKHLKSSDWHRNDEVVFRNGISCDVKFESVRPRHNRARK
jgi:hypothetical protein